MHVDFAYTYIKLCGFKDSHGIALCMWLGCGLQVMLVGKKKSKAHVFNVFCVVRTARNQILCSGCLILFWSEFLSHCLLLPMKCSHGWCSTNHFFLVTPQSNSIFLECSLVSWCRMHSFAAAIINYVLSGNFTLCDLCSQLWNTALKALPMRHLKLGFSETCT